MHIYPLKFNQIDHTKKLPLPLTPQQAFFIIFQFDNEASVTENEALPSSKQKSEVCVWKNITQNRHFENYITMVKSTTNLFLDAIWYWSFYFVILGCFWREICVSCGVVWSSCSVDAKVPTTGLPIWQLSWNGKKARYCTCFKTINSCVFFLRFAKMQMWLFSPRSCVHILAVFPCAR